VFLVLPNVESAALFSCPFVLTMRQMLNLEMAQIVLVVSEAESGGNWHARE